MADQPKKKLTSLERRFAHRVSLGINPTQALRDVGWKGTRPEIKSCKMMALPHVREYIDQLDQDAMREAGVTRVQIVKELARIAFADVRKILTPDGVVKPVDEWDDDTAAVVGGVDIEELWEGRGKDRQAIGNVRKIKLWNKREALAELSAIAGMKRDHVAQAVVGPGLTVIVQQGTQVNGQQVVQTHRVDVQLPKPA